MKKKLLVFAFLLINLSVLSFQTLAAEITPIPLQPPVVDEPSQPAPAPAPQPAPAPVVEPTEPVKPIVAPAPTSRPVIVERPENTTVKPPVNLDNYDIFGNNSRKLDVKGVLLICCLGFCSSLLFAIVCLIFLYKRRNKLISQESEVMI